MLKKLLETETDMATLILRLGLGLMIFPHGAQKLLGWFGGYGFGGTMQYFTDTMGIPYIFALAAILAEFFGGLALLAGIGTRIAALLVGVTLGVAAGMSHLSNGFFMNWSGTQQGEGLEFFVLALAMSAALMFRGAGSFGLDGLLARRLD